MLDFDKTLGEVAQGALDELIILRIVSSQGIFSVISEI